MDLKESVTKAVFSAIDDVNQMRSGDEQLTKSLDKALYGPTGGLDSLGLINLIVATEQKIDEAFGASITLSDESVMSEEKGVLESVGSFVDYIVDQLIEVGNELNEVDNGS